VFPVRYEMDLYILFRRNSVFKGLSGFDLSASSVLNLIQTIFKHCLYHTENTLRLDYQAVVGGAVTAVTAVLSILLQQSCRLLLRLSPGACPPEGWAAIAPVSVRASLEVHHPSPVA
jgi:hypothetical protein